MRETLSEDLICRMLEEESRRFDSSAVAMTVLIDANDQCVHPRKFRHGCQNFLVVVDGEFRMREETWCGLCGWEETLEIRLFLADKHDLQRWIYRNLYQHPPAKDLSDSIALDLFTAAREKDWEKALREKAKGWTTIVKQSGQERGSK